MKGIRSLVFAIGVVVAASAWGAGGHSHAPQHGGVVTESKEADYELVAKPDVIQLYIRHHDKTVDIKGASAKVTFLTGNEKSEVALAPAGNKLEARGSFKVGAGTKAVAVVSRSGKPVQAVRFVVK